MATTGFWPVHSNLKATIEYADNPDKTTDPRCLDEDLAAALRYAEDDRKTDRKMYVSGIHCSKALAYEQMMAVKRRFGERGTVIAYHGYQSFATGEVTPEEAHQIGLETARRMWGDRYQVVVTTHLNTDNIHNHFVVNSVSYVDGIKFRNKIGDHFELRRVSDTVCREHGKSILKNAPFYGGEKKAYWVHKSGKLTHRDIVRRDVDYAVSISTSWQGLEYNLKQMGYTFTRALSIKAAGWERAVRIPSLGPEYDPQVLRQKMMENWDKPYQPYYKPTALPLLGHEERYYHARSHDLVTVYFELAVAVLQLMAEVVKTGADMAGVPISPAMRQEVRNFNTFLEDFRFLRENGVVTVGDLDTFIRDKTDRIDTLEADRQHIRNHIRRPKDEGEKAENKEKAKEITKELQPIRHQLLAAKRIKEKYPKLKKAMDIEFAMEAQLRDKGRHKSHNYERGIER